MMPIEIICHIFGHGMYFLLIIGFRYFTKFWKSYALVTAPMVLLPVAFAEGGSEEMRCAYVVLLMAAYWMTEALPLAITSLIPMVLLPFLGKCNNILKVQKKKYFVKTLFQKRKKNSPQ